VSAPHARRKRKPPPKTAYERWIEEQAHRQERAVWKARDDLLLLIISKLRPLTTADLNQVNELIDHIMLLKRITPPA
jgi:hypothetical protein